MATEVNQNYFAWSQEESSVQDISQGASQLFGHGSISFGRFDLESLEWEKWSVFTNDRRHEEFGKFNGLVAKKKAYFEEYFKRVRELKALQQQNQQTELNLEYSSDGSDSSHAGEYQPAAEHGDPTGSGTLVDDSTEQTTVVEHEAECYDDLENGGLFQEISEATHSSSVGGSQQQMRGNDNGRMDMPSQSANSSQDDPGMTHETMMTPKRRIEKDSWTSPASKVIPKTVKMASCNVPDRRIGTKEPYSGNPSFINQITKPENVLLVRKPRDATCNLVGTKTGLTRPSSAASQRPSTRERRPVTRDALQKPAEVTTPCRPSTSERRPTTRDSALKHANVSSPHRPSTADKRPITKASAPKQSNIATPCRPSTADRRPITKESAPKLSNIATPRRPSTADRRPITKGSAPKQSNVASLHRPCTGERCSNTRDMATKHAGSATSYWPSTDKRRPVTRETADKHADVVTICRQSTAERRSIARDVAAKHAIVAPPHRPSTAERRPVARETALKQANVASSRWPLTPDRCRTRESDIRTPGRPSTEERRPITNDSTLKPDPKTPIRLRGMLNYSKGAMATAVTPKRTSIPNLAKSSKQDNISYAKGRVELQVDGKLKSSSFNLPPRKMMNSNVRDNRLGNSRKPNKEERLRAQAFESNNAIPSQTGSIKTKAPIPPPPPPPPPCRLSCTERKPNVNNSLAGGRKPKASTPRWH